MLQCMCVRSVWEIIMLCLLGRSTGVIFCAILITLACHRISENGDFVRETVFRKSGKQTLMNIIVLVSVTSLALLPFVGSLGWKQRFVCKPVNRLNSTSYSHNVQEFSLFAGLQIKQVNLTYIHMELPFSQCNVRSLC
jgi:formate/nitrite transporter FocA (FNT family)